jgi:hypothetical protein
MFNHQKYRIGQTPHCFFKINKSVKAITLVVMVLSGLVSLQAHRVQASDDVLVEAESFTSHGGWKLDTQFIKNMGSPYLLAHGLGRPVDDATTQVVFPSTGTYRVFVRTKDWVARWKAPGTPGRFQLVVNGKALKTTFGTEGAKWHWHDGGRVEIDKLNTNLALRDLTGFDGRCDAIFFTKDQSVTPPNESTVLSKWRRSALGLGDKPTEKSGYDLVVVGGGYSGMGAALSAARMGCKVALIQNRPVLGGNGSSEVRVWAMGMIRRGKYPRIGEIVEEFSDHAKKSPGTKEEFGDPLKEKIVRAQKNIDLYLNHHAYKVEATGKDLRRITAIHAFDTRTSEHKRFTSKFYVDCTGHGTMGYLAGAKYEMTPKGRMGMSNMWRWDEAKDVTSYPKTPWALPLSMADFPYPRNHHGQWFWESGFDKDAISDAEGIRDWNLRAVYGAFNAMKNGDGAAKHKKAYLSWVAFIGGPRESRRLMGGVVLTQDDVVAKRQFPDGCVPSTWSIDLHYPKQQYAKKFPDNPFISYAVHDRRVDRSFGYPVPYRCFYSENVSNLFMAGRCISVTHEALGTVRVMKTCGMMGEVVGKAASVCVKHNCLPSDVYPSHWPEMDELLKLPGKAHRATPTSEITIPKDALQSAGPYGPMTGLDPSKMKGIVVDDETATVTGKWHKGGGLKGFVGYSYRYASSNSEATITFKIKLPKAGIYDIRVAYLSHENRGNTVPVKMISSKGEKIVKVNMKKPAPLPNDMISVGKVSAKAGDVVTVVISSKGANGNAHADAVQAIEVK